jgi:hypothetical protein
MKEIAEKVSLTLKLTKKTFLLTNQRSDKVVYNLSVELYFISLRQKPFSFYNMIYV